MHIVAFLLHGERRGTMECSQFWAAFAVVTVSARAERIPWPKQFNYVETFRSVGMLYLYIVLHAD